MQKTRRGNQNHQKKTSIILTYKDLIYSLHFVVLCMTSQKLWHTLVNQTFWIYCLTLIAMPAGYINKIIISADLSVAQVWILYSLLSLMGIIVMYNDLWFKESMVYFLPKFLVQKKYHSIKSTVINMLIIQIVTGIWFALLMYLTSWWLAQYYFHDLSVQIVIQWMTLYLIIQCLNPDSLFLVFQDAFWHKMIQMIGMVGIMMMSIVIHFYGYPTIKRFAWAYILFSCITLCIGAIVLRYKHLKHIRSQAQYRRNIKELKQIIKYSLGVLVSNNLIVLLGSIDLLLIMALLGPIDAWYYSNYVTLTGVIAALIWPVFSLILPITSDLHARWAYQQIQSLNSVLMTYIVVIAIRASCFGIMFGPEIATWLLWNKFAYSWQIAQLWFVGVPIGLAVRIMFVMFAGTGMVMHRIKTLCVGIVVNILAIILTWILGRWLYGVVLSVIASRSVIAILSWKQIDPLLKPRIQRWRILKNIAVWLTIAGVLKYIWYLYIRSTDRREILLIIVGFWMVYGSVMIGSSYYKLRDVSQHLYNLYRNPPTS